jgi:hypothetical protein
MRLFFVGLVGSADSRGAVNAQIRATCQGVTRKIFEISGGMRILSISSGHRLSARANDPW